MKRLFVVMLLTIALVLSVASVTGCHSYTEPAAPPPSTPETTLPTTPPVTTSPSGQQPVIPNLTIRPSYDQHWITPVVYEFHNVGAGSVIDTWTDTNTDPLLGHVRGQPLHLRLHNGNDVPATFWVYYRDNRESPRADFADAPYEVKSWVTISEEYPMLQPKETRDIYISVIVPSTAGTMPPQFEFQITVRTGIGEASIVKPEMNTRWLVTWKK